jgi:hypothetical protein
VRLDHLLSKDVMMILPTRFGFEGVNPSLAP